MKDLFFTIGIIGMISSGIFAGIYGTATKKINILKNEFFIIMPQNINGFFISIGILLFSMLIVYAAYVN